MNSSAHQVSKSSANRIFILSLVLAMLTLTCTHFLRSEYVPSADGTKASTDGWNIYPWIRSNQSSFQGDIPVFPDSMVFTFVASHPVPPGKEGAPIVDVQLDSVRFNFPPDTTYRTYRINEAAFVSYREVSPDSIIKRFSVFRPGSNKLVWQKLSSGAKELVLDYYLTTDSGSLGVHHDSAGSAEVDTIRPGGAQRQSKVLTSTLVRRDRRREDVIIWHPKK